MNIEEIIENLLFKSYDLNLLIDVKNKAIELCKNEEEKINVINKIRDFVQFKASQSCLYSDHSLIFAATGVGKSKIAIDRCQRIVSNILGTYELVDIKPKILLVVPTEKLRDVGWKDEFEKWNQSGIYDNYLQTVCYASLNKIKDQGFDLVIYDEIHNITENNSIFFKDNSVEQSIGLTATKPKEDKMQILTNYGFKTTFELSLDDAVKLGIVAPFDITVVTFFLDAYVKCVEYKGKKITEKAYYDILTNTLKSPKVGAAAKKNIAIKRMHLIYNSKTKSVVAKYILSLFPSELRTLIFCGSKEEAEKLCPNVYHSGTNDEALNKYINGEINWLSCVKSLNEGHNLPNTDAGFIIQLNSNDKDLVQRIGRVIRFRPNHRGKIIILSCVNTQDKDWVASATKNLNVKIETKRYGDIFNNIDKLEF